MELNAVQPTRQEAQEAMKRVKEEQESVMEELNQMEIDGKTENRNRFVIANEEGQESSISSVVNCEDKFTEAFVTSHGNVFQETQKILIKQKKYTRHFYLLLATNNGIENETKLDLWTSFIWTMYHNTVDLKNQSFALLETIRQLKSDPNSTTISLHSTSNFEATWRLLGDVMFQLIYVDILLDKFPECAKRICRIREQIRRFVESKATVDRKSEFEEHDREQVHAQKVLFNGECFRGYYESPAGEVDKCRDFPKVVAKSIQDMLNVYNKPKNNSPPDDHFFCGIVAITVWYYHHFYNHVELPVVKKVIDAAKTVKPYRWLGEECFVPLEYLRCQISNKQVFSPRTTQLARKMVDEARNYMMDKEDEMVKEMVEYFGYADTWLRELNAKKSEHLARESSASELKQWGLDFSEFYLKGLRIIEKFTSNLRHMFRCRRSRFHDMPMSTWNVAFSAIETTKKMEMIIMRDWNLFEEAFHLARQTWRKQMLGLLETAKKSYSGIKLLRNRDEEETMKSLFHIAEAQCIGQMNSTKTLVLQLALNFGSLETHLSTTNQNELFSLLNRLKQFSRPQDLLVLASSTALFFTNDIIVSKYFMTILRRRPQERTLMAFFRAYGGYIRMSEVIGQDEVIMSQITEVVNSSLLRQITAKLDMDMRILANPDLSVGQTEQNKVPEEEMSYIAMLTKNVHKIQVYKHSFRITEPVAEAMQGYWYQMEILASSRNTKVYTTMMQILQTKFGIELRDTYLSKGGVDESLVLVELIKNFHQFLPNFCYYSQHSMFLEKTSDVKRLQMICQKDLEKALQQNGVGYLPTAVNVAYILIRNKLQTLMAFLSEDVVRNHTRRYLQEMKEKKEKAYQLEWAVTLAGILGQRKNPERGPLSREPMGSEFGRSEAGSQSADIEFCATYFDKFRQIVIQIGNAISFIRILCQAAREVFSSRQDLFSAIKANIDGMQSATSARLEEAGGSASNDKRIRRMYRMEMFKNMFDKVSDYTDYVKTMCIEFKTLLLESNLPEDRMECFEYFHGIVPALTVSQVNYLYAHENRVRRMYTLQNNQELIITDDGFTAGLAFLMLVMNQTDQFESLKWFKHYENKLDSNISKMATSSNQATNLAYNRLCKEKKILKDMEQNYITQRALFTLF